MDNGRRKGWNGMDKDLFIWDGASIAARLTVTITPLPDWRGEYVDLKACPVSGSSARFG